MVGPATKADVTQVRQTRRFDIENVADDGTAEVTMQYENVHMKITPWKSDPIAFDTSMKPDEIPPEFASVARQLKGSAPEYKLQPMGPVVDKEGVVDASPEHSASFSIPLPKEPVSVGDSWKVNYKAKVRLGKNLMRDVTLLRTFKLTEVNDEIAKITFSTSIQGRLASPSEKAQLIKATPSGTIDFDITKGRLIRREIKHNKTVFGAMGRSTMLTSVGQTIETLLPEKSVTQAANTGPTSEKSTPAKQVSVTSTK